MGKREQEMLELLTRSERLEWDALVADHPEWTDEERVIELDHFIDDAIESDPEGL